MTGILFILTPLLQIVQGNDGQATGLRLLHLIAGGGREDLMEIVNRALEVVEMGAQVHLSPERVG